MANTDKKYDWLAALAQNPDLGIADFKKLGVTPENSDFKSKSEYENNPKVIELFKNSTGEFDKKAFDQFYDNALISYNNYSNEEYLPKASELFGYLDSEWDRPRGSKVMNVAPTFNVGPASSNSFGMSYINQWGPGFVDQSTREIAEQQEAVDFETGQGLGWTPDDKGGLFKGLVRPTLVLATYDEEGDYEENGELVHHLKGDLKLRNGKPYAETLGNRSLNGKQVIGYADTITREGSWLNKYDFFDSDGLDKSLIGTIAKTAFTVTPYLIPGVGEVLGALTAFTALNRVLPEFSKAVNGILGQNENNEFSKSMNEWAGWFARFDPSVSDYSQQHLVSWENLGNLISSVSGQLFQQRVVGAIPRLLNQNGNIANQANWGRKLAYGYMSITSAQGSYDTFKEAGASDMVAGWAFVANMLALTGLMNTDYGKGILFKGSWLDENVIREPSLAVAKDVLNGLTEGIENAPVKERAKAFQKLVNFYSKYLSSAAPENFITRGLSESLEEVIEEGALDVSKILASTAQSLGINTGDKELDFGWSTTDILQRYGMAAAGGFIGGGIFSLQNKWDKFLANDLVQHTDEDNLQRLAYYIGQGRGQEIRDYYSKWHTKGLLGSTTLGTNLTSVEGVNGTEMVAEAAGNKLSQNDVVYNTLINYIDSIEDTIKSEGLQIDIGSLTRNAINGYKETPSALRSDTLINLGIHDLLIKDVYDLAGKIVKTKAALQAEINNLTVKEDNPDAKKETDNNIKNSAKIKELEDKLNKLREQRDLILSGKNNWRYAQQAIFASNTELAKGFLDLSIENFTRLKYGKVYTDLSEEEKAAIDADYAEYQRNEGKNQLLRAADVYLGASQRFAQRLEAEEQSLQGYSADDLHNVGTDFQENFIKLLKEYSENLTQLSALQAKEDKTEEDNTKIAELKTRQADLEKQLGRIQQQPYTALVHHSDKYKGLLDALSAPVMTPELESALFSGIKQMYEDYRTNRMQLNGDGELNAALNRVKREFLSAASVDQRVDSWFRNLVGQFIEETPDGEDTTRWGEFIDATFGAGNYNILPYYDDEETEFLKHIKELGKSFVDNLGVDNVKARADYDQLVTELKESGIPAEYTQSLLQALVPEITYEGKATSIMDYLSELDKIRKDVKYSSFEDLLQEFAVDMLGTRINLLDLIKEQRNKLAGVNALSDYVIRNNNISKELENAERLIKIVQSLIRGTVDKTNSSINAFKGNPIKLAELSENVANILYRQSFSLLNEINSLKELAKLNGLKILRIHEDIDKHMRALYLHTLINNPAFVNAFKDKFFIKDEDGNKTPVDIKAIADSFLTDAIDLSAPDTINPRDLMEFEIKFATELYHQVQKSTIGKNTEELAKALVSLFGNNVWKMETSTLFTDTDTISQYSLMSYLKVLLSVPAEDFYTKYTTVTQAEDAPFAPIYSQELGLRYIAATISRPDLDNAILAELKAQANSYAGTLTDKESKIWIENLTALQNFICIQGGAGVGKTQAIARTTAKMYEGYDHEFICVAPTTGQAENLAKAVGENVHHTDKDTFFKTAFGTKFDNYSFLHSTRHWTATEIPVYNDKVFDASKKLKILFVDEISLFTESELKALSDYAVRNGIIIVGLGDQTQNSGKVYSGNFTQQDGKINTVKPTWHSTGLEDCLYTAAPYLTASLRGTNLAKYENFLTFTKELDKVQTEWKKKRELSFGELDAFVSPEIQIDYFENEPTGILYGEKFVDNSVDLKALADKYKTKGRVAIITDNLDKYQGLDKNIQLVPYHEMQGGEWDYVLVDVNFEENNTIGTNYSKYAALRDLYTLSQRSKVASIIKDNGIKDKLNIKNNNNPTLNQPTNLSEGDIKTFKTRRGQILDGLAKTDNLYDYIHEFKKPVTSPAPSPAPNPTTPPPAASGGNPVPQGQPGVQPGTSVPPTVSTPNPTGTPAPVGPPVAKSGRSVVNNARKKATSRIFSGEFNGFLRHPDFRASEVKNPTSLANWKEANFKGVNIPSGTYRNLISHLGSSIRTEIPMGIVLDQFLNQILNDPTNQNKRDLTYGMISELKRIFSGIPDVYISEYDSEKKVITARYKVTSKLNYDNIPYSENHPLVKLASTSFKDFPEGVTEVIYMNQQQFPVVRFEHNGMKFMFTFHINTKDDVVPTLTLYDTKSDTYKPVSFDDVSPEQLQRAVERYLPKDFLTILNNFHKDKTTLIDEKEKRFEQILHDKYNIYYLNASLLGSEYEATDPSIIKVKSELVHGTENSYIEMPIGFARTALSGRYTGKFKRNQNLRISEQDQQWRPLEQFIADFPGVEVCGDWGIVSDTVTGFDKGTTAYLKGNSGKVAITLSDEPMYARTFFRNWFEREQIGEKIWSVSHYNDLILAMIQKPVDPVKVLQFVNALHNKDADRADIQRLMDRGLWEDPEHILGELTGNSLSDLPTGEEYYKTINSRAWQVLPRDRADLFVSSALDVLKGTEDYNTLMTSLTMFMHTIGLPNDRINGERHAIILSSGDKAYWIQTNVKDGHIIGYTAKEYYPNGSFGPKESEIFFPIERQFPYDKIKQQLFGSSQTQISLKRAIMNKENIPSYQNLTANDTIFTMFRGAKFNLEQLSSRLMSYGPFINGVYINDPGGDRFSPTSAYRKFIGNKSGYWIKGGIEPSIWSIDESSIQPIEAPVDPMDTVVRHFTNTFNSILNILPTEYQQKFREYYDWGVRECRSGKYENENDIITKLISSINNTMAFTQDNWMGKKVVWAGDRFILEDVNNMDLWKDRIIRSKLNTIPGIEFSENLIDKIEVMEDRLDRWKYGVFGLHVPNLHESNESFPNDVRPITLIYEGNEWKLYKISVSTTIALAQMLDTVDSINQNLPWLSQVRPYINSLQFHWNNSNKVDAVKASQIIKQNSPELLAAINNYLEQRILNDEC